MQPTSRRLRPLALTLALFTAAWGGPLAAQSPVTTYRAQRDTVFVEDENPHRMYWVTRGDTLGDHVRPRSVAFQIWQTGPSGLRIMESRTNLAAERTETHHRFDLTSAGRVQRVDSAPPGLDTQIDLLPPLPARRLALGTTWTDTLTGRAPRPGGDGVFTIVRTYRVDAVRDSAGMSVISASATGEVHYRDAWWSDSAAGQYAWIDVSGPVTEHFRVDARKGLLLARDWTMDLRGTGGRPDSTGRADTVAAGLESSSKTWRVAAARAHLVGRPLPGTDTTFSIDPGLILSHTVLRQGDSIASSMSRNDGMVGTVTTWLTAGSPRRQHAAWTDSLGETTESDITLTSGGLLIHRTGHPDTTVVLPEGTWGIADYAMQEHLVPLLAALPADVPPVPISIYRPVGGHWDHGKVLRHVIPGGSVIQLQIGDSSAAQYLVFTDDQDLLYVENSDPTGARRLPRPGSARYATLEHLLEALKSP